VQVLVHQKLIGKYPNPRSKSSGCNTQGRVRNGPAVLERIPFGSICPVLPMLQLLYKPSV
jgi:hypothetical protein